MKRLIYLILFLLSAILVSGYIWRIEAPEYDVDKILDYENFTENFTLAPGSSIKQDDYYIAPCETNDFIDGSAVCLWSNATTALDVPYAGFQPGGAEQASWIAGSLMLVDRNQTNLLNVNRTSCKEQADMAGVDLMIDCNSTSPDNPLGTGPDFLLFGDEQISGEFWIRDTGGEWHFISRQSDLWDELTDDVIFNNIIGNVTSGVLRIIDKEGDTLVVNIDRNTTIFTRANDSVSVNTGTDSNPERSFVTYQDTNNPTLTVGSTHPSGIEHAEICRLVIGSSANQYAGVCGLETVYEFVTRITHHISELGFLYEDGFNITASSSSLTITTGAYDAIGDEIDTTNSLSMAGGYYLIESDGTFVEGTDLTSIAKYADGDTISANRRVRVIWGAVRIENGTQGAVRLMAIVQDKPRKEYKTAREAEDANPIFLNFFPADNIIDDIFIPIADTIVDVSGNDFEEFDSNGFFFRDIRGTTKGAGGAPPQGGDNLGNHIATADLNMSGNNIVEVDNVTVGTRLKIEGASEINIQATSPYFGVDINADPSFGWSRYFGFYNSSVNLLGAFGGAGSADKLTNLWIGASSTDPNVMKIFPKTGNVEIANDVTANTFNGSWNESFKFQLEIGSDCSVGQFVKGVDNDGTLDCDTPTGGGGGAGDKWLDNGDWISPNATFASWVNASLFTANLQINMTKGGIKSAVGVSINASDFYDDGVLLTPDTTIGNETTRVDLIIETYIPNNATADRSYTDTRVDSIENFTMQQINDSFKNWSQDKDSYAITTDIDTWITSNDTSANDSMKVYVDAQDSAQDECSEINGCVENALINGTNKVVNFGKVGIGVENSAAELDVRGDINTTAIILAGGRLRISSDPVAMSTPAKLNITVSGGGGKVLTIGSDVTLNQDVSTSSAVSFTTVNTGQGANDLYDMNQNVKTDSTPEFLRMGLGKAASGFSYQPLEMVFTRANSFGGWYVKNLAADGITRFSVGMTEIEGTLGILFQYDNEDGRGIVLNRKTSIGTMELSTTGGGLKVLNDGNFQATDTYSQDISPSASERALYINSSGDIGVITSSKRYKENIVDLPDSISSKIYDLKTYQYDQIRGEKNQIGMTAEEVSELFPQCVSYLREEILGEICLAPGDCFIGTIGTKLVINKTTGKKIPDGINYGCLITPLIREVQKSNQEIQMLKDELCSTNNNTYSWCNNLYYCSTNPTRKETCTCLSGSKMTCYYETCGKSPWGRCTAGEWIKVTI